MTSRWPRLLGAVLAVAALAGCAGDGCVPAPQPAEHEWLWYAGPLDLDGLGAALEEGGWAVGDRVAAAGSEGWVLHARKAVEGENVTLSVVSLEGSTSVKAESSALVRYLDEAVRALAPVTAELNATLEGSFGAPRVVRYDAGFPCADV